MTRKLYENCTKNVRKLYGYMWSPPKLPRKMRPRNMLVIFLSKNDQKSLNIWPGRHVQNLGVAFFLEKNAGGSLPRSTWVFCPAKSRMACMAWLLGKDQSWQNKHFTKTWFWSWLGSIWLQIEFWPAPWAGNFEPELMKGTVCLQISQNIVKYVGIRPGF